MAILLHLIHQKRLIMNILIVGATGQLGYAIAQKLRGKPHQVYALHRRTSDIQPLRELGYVQLRTGDLTEPASLKAALEGIDTVICTANSAVPSQKSDNFERVDKTGVISLIEEAKAQGIQQFIYVSAISYGPLDAKIPLARAKRQVEQHLRESGLPYTIFQPTAFMDVHFAYMGTELPLAGSRVATVRRPFKFANQFFAGIKNDMEQKGRINIVGDGSRRASYICIKDVAQFCVNAIGKPAALGRTIPIGGPEALTALEVKSHFEQVYGKPLKVKSTPAPIMRLMSVVLAPFNINAANIMALNHAGATRDTIIADARELAAEFGVELHSVEDYLREKAGFTP
jgi:uncharacterized protein YbjT (DUF2867 family)